MEFFEELALRTAPARPRIWKRYVDDTFTLVKKGDVDELLTHLNSIRPSIKLTTELEEGGSIPFLDTRVTRKVDGKLDVTVYRKPTHTDRYLHFSSHHPTHVKKGLVRCLYDRARNITSLSSCSKPIHGVLRGTSPQNSTRQATYLEALCSGPRYHARVERSTSERPRDASEPGSRNTKTPALNARPISQRSPNMLGQKTTPSTGVVRRSCSALATPWSW